MITVVFMYAVLAATFTVAKITLSYATPYFIIGFRMTVAGLLFLGFQYLFNRKHFFLRKQDIGLFIKVSFFYIYLAFIPEFWALQYLSSSKVVIIYSITPFIAATFAYFLAKERLTIKKIGGMIVGSLGIIPLLMTQDDIREAATEILKISLPEVVLLVAVVSAAYAWFPIKRLMDRGYTLPMINGITMLLGGIGAFITCGFFEGISTNSISEIGPFLFWVMLLILLSNVIFYNMYGWHLRRYSFTILSFAGFLCPIFGSFYGWYFLGETIRWNHFAALGFVGTGLYLFYQDEFNGRKRV